MSIRTRRVIIRICIAVSFALLALDVLVMHSAVLLIAPVTGILAGVAYLHSTAGRRLGQCQ